MRSITVIGVVLSLMLGCGGSIKSCRAPNAAPPREVVMAEHELREMISFVQSLEHTGLYEGKLTDENSFRRVGERHRIFSDELLARSADRLLDPWGEEIRVYFADGFVVYVGSKGPNRIWDFGGFDDIVFTAK